MANQVCGDTSEATELSSLQRLYLKPVAKLGVHVTLPEIKVAGVSISNWEVMEKLKSMIAPDQFAVLRVVESSLEFIRFEGEADAKSLVSKFVSKLDGKSIKLSGFADPLKVRAAESKLKFPTAHDWNSFFRESEDLDERNPGERPDTVQIKGLPCKWFADSDSPGKPSEEVLITVFRRFGKIRCVDIPILDPYRQRLSKGNSEFQTFYYGSHLHFDAFIQYSQYQGFSSAMSALKGMKLMFISDEGRAATANIQVDFDRTCHLSVKNIKSRDQERQRLIDIEQAEEERKMREKEEEERRQEEELLEQERKKAEEQRLFQEAVRRKEERKRAKEEKRRQKHAERVRREIERRERQRQLEKERERERAEQKTCAKRLLMELLQRAAAAKEKENEERKKLEEEQRKREQELEMLRQMEEKKRKLEEEQRRREDEQRRKKEKLEEQERELRDKLIQNLKKMEQRRDELKKQLLQRQIASNMAKLNSFLSTEHTGK
ncbi:A-kinase anchor protein 17A-like [Montipora capricornis]|uniref:A-kinase anchor protein 17A-like n=1 Tax=Montipora capricornis TaxID=246305 RepID=UPI0035F12F7B